MERLVRAFFADVEKDVWISLSEMDTYGFVRI